MSGEATRIGDLGRVVTGRTPSSKIDGAFGESYAFVTPTDMDGGKFVATARRLSQLGAEAVAGARVPAGSVAVSCIGWQMGKVAYLREECFTNQQLNTIIPNERADSHFIYYALSTRQAEFKTLGSGGTRTPILNKSRFSDVEVLLPPVPTQRRIAGILSAYDDLIENNTKRIKILEEMARALYREWFVHFRFPGHEKVKLVDSPLGQIPEGWEVIRLAEVQANVRNAINGGPFGSKLGRKDYVADGVPVIRGANLTTGGRFKAQGFVFVSVEKAQELNANLARPGDIVVTQRGTLGQVARIPDNTGYDEFVISQSQMKATLDKGQIDNDYALYAIKSSESVERLKNLASCSGVPHINLGALRDFTIRRPPLDIQRGFGKVVGGMEVMIENLIQQNQVLGGARDLLLPRLISGEIGVDNLDLPQVT